MFGKGAPDVRALAACVRARDGLSILSAERVRVELLRLLAAPHAADIVLVMHDYGLITQVLGTAPRPTLLARLVAIEAALGVEADAVRRLAALAVEVPDDGERLRDRLRLSNAEGAALVRAGVHTPDIGPTASIRAAKAYLYAQGEAAYRQHVLLGWARSGDAPGSEDWRHRVALPDVWQVPRFPIGGADVTALGVSAGPRVGDLLRTLEDWWIAGDFSADEGGLRAKLRELTADGKGAPRSRT